MSQTTISPMKTQGSGSNDLAPNSSQELYVEDLLEEAKNPSCYGLATFEMENQSSDLVQLEATHYNASCGDSITVRVFVNADETIVHAIRWEGMGCIISQASMSVLSRSLEGKPVSEVRLLDQASMLELLGLSEISMGRIKCLVLGLRAVQKVLDNAEKTHVQTNTRNTHSE